MNYRHIYHAGNFADIIKHLTLVAILEALKKKEKPFAVLDAFAGIGLYDLAADEAVRSGESASGIGKVHKILEGLDPLPLAAVPLLIEKFLTIIKPYHPSHYPGSPLIIANSLRTQDRLIASELHSHDHLILKQLFALEKKASIHKIDAYMAVKAFLPFKENRGLVLLDPPFEVKDEFSKLLSALEIIRQRAANICTFIWYPLKCAKDVKKFRHDYEKLDFKESFTIEFELPDYEKDMNKCALLVINPPNIQEEVVSAIQYLADNIYKGKARVSVISFPVTNKKKPGR